MRKTFEMVLNVNLVVPKEPLCLRSESFMTFWVLIALTLQLQHQRVESGAWQTETSRTLFTVLSGAYQCTL